MTALSPGWIASKSSRRACSWISVAGTGHLQGFDVGFAEELAGRDLADDAATDQPLQVVGGNAGARLAQAEILRSDDCAHSERDARDDALREHRPERGHLSGHLVLRYR